MNSQTKKESEIRKNRKILEKIITVYHPQYLNQNIDELMSHNVSHLLEQTMAHVGGYEFVDAAHYDFSDGSDCKTSTVSENGKGTTYQMSITHTISRAGIVKSGDLRVVVYNNVTDDLEYFFIPQCVIESLSWIDTKRGGGEINCSYNSKTQQYTKIQQYKVPDFVILCCQHSTISFDDILEQEDQENAGRREATKLSIFKKNKRILEDIIKVYNPNYKDLDISDPMAHNVSRMLEETMAYVGGYEVVDNDHHDFSDGTECKTGTITLNKTTDSKNTHRFIISNTISQAGIEKTGDLRVVVYNNMQDSLLYFFIPQRYIRALSTLGIDGKARIEGFYNSVSNRVEKLNFFRVQYFEKLCTIESTSGYVETTLEEWFSSDMENENECVN